MKLFYFSESNLRNNFFIREFVSAYAQQKGKVLLLHEPFDSVQDTRFVTKRLSSLLSEVMVVNAAFSGDQKGFLSKGKSGISLKEELIEGLFKTVDMLILNTVCLVDGGTGLANGIEVAKELQGKLPFSETLLFAVNSKSPVVQERKLVAGSEDIGNWLEVYEEEKAALENAIALAPAYLSSTRLF